MLEGICNPLLMAIGHSSAVRLRRVLWACELQSLHTREETFTSFARPCSSRHCCMRAAARGDRQILDSLTNAMRTPVLLSALSLSACQGVERKDGLTIASPTSRLLVACANSNVCTAEPHNSDQRFLLFFPKESETNFSAKLH